MTKNDGQQQPYDSSFKGWLHAHVQSFVPLFLEGAGIEGELNTEILRPPLRTDAVYFMNYRKQPHTLQVEIQSVAERDLVMRLLVYHVLLLREYGRPVISVILYPFKTSMASSPFLEMSGKEELLRLNYRVISLGHFDAQRFLEERAISMYPLLSLMQHADSALLLQAMREMVEYYRDDRDQLSHELTWFKLLLRRSDMVPQKQKQVVEEQLMSLDEFVYTILSEDPDVQRIVQTKVDQQVEEVRAKAETEGEIKGALHALREVIVNTAEQRFPSLTALARERVEGVREPTVLWKLFSSLNAAQDETTARAALTSSEA